MRSGNESGKVLNGCSATCTNVHTYVRTYVCTTTAVALIILCSIVVS